MHNTASKATGVTVTVNGKRWRLVPSLAGSGPRDGEFTVVQAAGGKTVDQALWVAIRNRSNAISFDFRERRRKI